MEIEDVFVVIFLFFMVSIVLTNVDSYNVVS